MNNDKPIIKPTLTTISLDPENKGAPIHFLNEWITPEELFFIRNHYDYPKITPELFKLRFEGLVEKHGYLRYDQILQMPCKTIVCPLECSGNKRKDFVPPTFGTQWDDGAISQGMWTGVSLKYILDIVGVKDSAYEVVFEGHDTGKIAGMEENYSFARSLPINVAMHPDTLIAYKMNNKTLSIQHGYPLRLIVPKWYAMASVKWLKKITIIDKPFEGPYQTPDYYYYPNEDNNDNGVPVTTMRVNSIIQQPLPQSTLDTGLHKIYGIAWTGEGVISKVEISFDKGCSWQQTVIQQDDSEKYSWTFWSYMWEINEKGKHTIMVKATDSAGREQPMKIEWNRLGYGYNGVSILNVDIV